MEFKISTACKNKTASHILGIIVGRYTEHSPAGCLIHYRLFLVNHNTLQTQLNEFPMDQSKYLYSVVFFMELESVALYPVPTITHAIVRVHSGSNFFFLHVFTLHIFFKMFVKHYHIFCTKLFLRHQQKVSVGELDQHKKMG